MASGSDFTVHVLKLNHLLFQTASVRHKLCEQGAGFSLFHLALAQQQDLEYLLKVSVKTKLLLQICTKVIKALRAQRASYDSKGRKMFSTLTGNKQSVSDTELLELSFVPEMEALYLQPCFTPIKAVTSLLPPYPIYANHFEASKSWGRMKQKLSME